MNCRRAQSDIALLVGNDLDEPGELQLRQHLEICHCCRGYLAEMQHLMQYIDDCPLREEGDRASKRAVEESLWPSLCTRLVSVPPPRTDHFNGWVPAVAVAAVCLAMVLIASPPQFLAPPDEASLSASGDPLLSAPAVAEPNRTTPKPRWNRLPIEPMPVGVAPLSAPSADLGVDPWEELDVDPRGFFDPAPAPRTPDESPRRPSHFDLREELRRSGHSGILLIVK